MNTEENRQGMEHLYETYADDIFRYFVLRMSNREKALDLTQEVFVRMWQSYVSKGVAVEYPKALLYRIAHNMLVNSYARDELHDSLETLVEDEGFDVVDHAQDTMQKVAGEELHRMLTRLSKEDAELITMRHIEGFSVKEIAEMKQISENTLSVRLHRALARLEDLYTKHEEHHD
jgi:RNA polymerase sigma-70 factor (ECF subfamily)